MGEVSGEVRSRCHTRRASDSVFVSHGEGGGLFLVNTEEEASVSWARSSKQMESRTVLELVSACECQDHPNNRIEGIRGQCQFLGLNTNIQTGH